MTKIYLFFNQRFNSVIVNHLGLNTCLAENTIYLSLHHKCQPISILKEKIAIYRTEHRSKRCGENTVFFNVTKGGIYSTQCAIKR
jgi:hypothetical protein